MAKHSQRQSDPTVDVGIVCALDLEAEPIAKRLKRRRRTAGHRFDLEEGVLGGVRVGVIRTGMKQGGLRAAAEALVLVHRPRWVIAAGFAVGLADDIQAGDIILPTELVNEASRRLAVDLRLPADPCDPPTARAGCLLSLRAWPRRSADKRALGARTGAIAADLQSFTLAEFCAKRGLRFLAIRVLTETVASDPGPESLAVYNPSRSYRTGAAVGAFLSGSGRASRIIKLRSAARKNAGRLAAILCEILPQLR